VRKFKSPKPTDGELGILNVLWSRGPVFLLRIALAALIVACSFVPVPGQLITQNTGSTYRVKKEIVATLFYIPEVSNKTPPSPPPSPFYAALPFNDLAHPDLAKLSLPSGWVKPTAPGEKPRSACLDRWLKITNPAGICCYAQWEDFGPGPDDDAEYVFGDKPPKFEQGAGIDLSPGAAKFLRIDDKNKIISWQFVDKKDVPSGPWL
jgi:hypothetical protein